MAFSIKQYLLDGGCQFIEFNISAQDEIIAYAKCITEYDKIINLRSRVIKINGMCYICSLYTHPDHRNKGHASLLLKTIIHYCQQHKIEMIMLEDCSDNYRNPNNIYLHHDFKYLDDREHTMVCYVT